MDAQGLTVFSKGPISLLISMRKKLAIAEAFKGAPRAAQAWAAPANDPDRNDEIKTV